MNRKSIRLLLLRYYEKPLVLLFDKLGFSPNGVTFFGLTITLIAAVFVSQGQFILGSILILLGGALDLIDGGLGVLGVGSLFIIYRPMFTDINTVIQVLSGFSLGAS